MGPAKASGSLVARARLSNEHARAPTGKHIRTDTLVPDQSLEHETAAEVKAERNNDYGRAVCRDPKGNSGRHRQQPENAGTRNRSGENGESTIGRISPTGPYQSRSVRTVGRGVRIMETDKKRKKKGGKKQ